MTKLGPRQLWGAAASRLSPCTGTIDILFRDGLHGEAIALRGWHPAHCRVRAHDSETNILDMCIRVQTSEPQQVRDLSMMV